MENTTAPTHPQRSVFIQNNPLPSHHHPSALPPPPTPSCAFFVQENTDDHLRPPPSSTPSHPDTFFFQNNTSYSHPLFPPPTLTHSPIFSIQENAPCLPPPPGFPQGMCYLHPASVPPPNALNYVHPQFDNTNADMFTNAASSLENNMNPLQSGGWQINGATQTVQSYVDFPNSSEDRMEFLEAQLGAMVNSFIIDDPTTITSVASTSATEESHISDPKKVNGRSSKNVAWRLDEHYMFLEGVRRFGHGKWKQISEMMGYVKTPAQIASHAQKHNIRKNTPHVLRKRRTIHDIDELNCTNLKGAPDPSQPLPGSEITTEMVTEMVTEMSTICDEAPIGVPCTSFESLNSSAPAVASSSGEGGDKTSSVIQGMVPNSSCMPTVGDAGSAMPILTNNFLYLSGFEAENYDMVDAVTMRNWWESFLNEGSSEIVSQPMSLENRRTLECWASLPCLSLEEEDWWTYL